MVVVLEEGIEPGSVDEDVIRVQDAQPPGGGAVARDTAARGAEVGIVDGRVHGEGGYRCRVWLVVPGEKRGG